VRFYNQRGTAEQWIEEGKNAVKWTKLSCHDFVDNQVRLQLFALAYNLGNFLRRLALPRSVKHWSLTTLREKLIKIGAKVVSHWRYVFFQIAEVAIPRNLFAAILVRIQRLRAVPGMAPSRCPRDVAISHTRHTQPGRYSVSRGENRAWLGTDQTPGDRKTALMRLCCPRSPKSDSRNGGALV
jgi:hypothetical protein